MTEEKMISRADFLYKMLLNLILPFLKEQLKTPVSLSDIKSGLKYNQRTQEVKP